MSLSSQTFFSISRGKPFTTVEMSLEATVHRRYVSSFFQVPRYGLGAGIDPGMALTPFPSSIG